MKTAFLLLSFLFAPLFVFAENFPEIASVFNGREVLQNAQFSAYAKYAGGEEIVSINPSLRLAPASVLKLFTTAAAFDLLGPDFNFETKIYYSGEIKGKKLTGDVYIKGSGDPTLGSARLASVPDLPVLVKSWAELFKEAGITKIQGNIYVDNSVFSGVLLPWRTSYQNIGNYYAAPSDGLSVRDNSYEIYFAPVSEDGAKAEILKTEPEMSNLSLQSYVKGSAAVRGENTFVNFVPASAEVQIFGSVPLTSAPVKISAAMPSPAAFMADYFKRALEENEIQVKGAALLNSPETYDDKTLLFSYFSPSLKEIVEYTNKRSFNLYADTILRSLSAYTGGSGSAGEGVRKVKEFLESMEIDSSNFDVFDGSGLSRDDIIDCKMTVEMLEKVLEKPYGETFMLTLPVAGDPEDGGTMSRRLKYSSAAYGAFVKTGSLDRVRAVAGYTSDYAGRRIVFCSLVNNYYGRMRQVDEVHDAFISGLSDIGLNKKPAARQVKK